MTRRLISLHTDFVSRKGLQPSMLHILELTWDTFGSFEISVARPCMGCVRLGPQSNPLFSRSIPGIWQKSEESRSVEFFGTLWSTQDSSAYLSSKAFKLGRQPALQGEDMKTKVRLDRYSLS